jgi:hypothetical protein
MSNPAELQFIPAGEILRPSSRFPAVLQDSDMPPFDGIFFENDLEAVDFKAASRPTTFGKVELPLELPMYGAFKLKDPDSGDRPDTDFRIVLADKREAAPAHDRECAVMPYVLFNGIISVALRVLEPEDESLFMPDSFWLNIFEPGMSQPFSGVTDSILQVILKPSERPAPEVVERYTVLKEKAGRILERIINTAQVG